MNLHKFRRLKNQLAFPFIEQTGMMECGTTCLAMIFRYYGYFNIRRALAQIGQVNTEGTDLYTISRIAEDFGFKTDAYQTTFQYLKDFSLPGIAHFEGNHFVVVYRATDQYVWVADPAYGKDKYRREDFEAKWNGILLCIEPTESIFANQDMEDLIIDQQQKHQSLFGKFYLASIAPQKIAIFEILIATFVLQILGLAVPFCTQAIIDQVLVNQNRRLLFGILAGMLVIFFGQIVLLYVRNILLVHFKTRFELGFFSRFFRHFIYLQQRFFDDHRREDFIIRFRENLKIRELASPAMLQQMADLLFIFIYLPVLFFYHYKLGILAAFFCLFYLSITLYFTPRIRRLVNKIFYKDISVLGKFLDTLLGIQTVKLLGAESVQLRKWRGEYRRNLNVVVDSEKEQILLLSIQRSVFFFSQVAIYWLGAYMTFNGQLTLGQYLAFITIFMIIMYALNNVSLLWLNLIRLSVTAERMNDVLIQDQEYVDVFEEKGIQKIETIHFENVSFRYRENDERYVLRQIDLRILEGERIGIVGRNGAGKTTLVKLLLNLYPGYEGRISCGHTELRRINPSRLRKRIYLFPQNVYIFNGTIRENILLARPDAGLEEIVAAAKLADLHEFVQSLYLNYNHQVGEGGANLSGGQILKIGFARLFLSRPDVIILDEANSMLDIETERRIMANVFDHFAGKTIISIAHRMHTLKDSDRILVMDQGKITEEGSHQALLEQDGLYAQFMSTYIS